MTQKDFLIKAKEANYIPFGVTGSQILKKMSPKMQDDNEDVQFVIVTHSTNQTN